MAATRRSLRLLPYEEELLRALYRELDIPTDQYPQRPDDLAELVGSWNAMTGRNEAAADVLHYMITRRKKGEWERLGRTARADSSRSATQLTSVRLSEDELHQLDVIHEELQVASDNFALNPELADKLHREFAKRTGRIIPAMVLAAMMITRRKSGSLATLKPKPDEQDLGFQDIEQIAK